MNSQPQPKCATVGCHRAALIGKLYCYLHNRGAGLRFYAAFKRLQARKAAK